MFDSLKKRWQEFKRGVPGRRFQERYFRVRKNPKSHFWKMALIGGGSLLMALGVVMLVAPGPGLLVLVLGASFVAQESLAAARALDSAEILLRRAAAWSLRTWRAMKRV